MIIMDSYRDLCKQISILEETRGTLENEIYVLNKLLNNTAPKNIKAMNYNDMPVGSKDFTSYDRIICRLKAAKENLKNVKELQLELLESKDKIKDDISQLEGIHYKVGYLKYIKDKKLKDIAEILNKDEGSIRNISSEINRMR